MFGAQHAPRWPYSDSTRRCNRTEPERVYQDEANIHNVSYKLLTLVLPACLTLVAADAWRNKPIAEWSPDDARQVLTDSPWAKTVQPTAAPGGVQRQSRRAGRAIGIGGVGIGLPGVGGMGRQGGDEPGSPQPSTLQVRWESALPIRAAELKVPDAVSPVVDEEHYAIVVQGIPNQLLNGNAEALGREFKASGAMKREGKKDLKPSSVEVLQREGGSILIYLFPRSTGITKQDKQVEFEATIFRVQVNQKFDLDEMLYQGKLEL